MQLGFPEMLFIFLLALLIFGPKKLPELGRQLGRAITEFKRASNEFKSQITDEMRALEAEEIMRSAEPVSITPPERPTVSTSSIQPTEPVPPEVIPSAPPSTNGGQPTEPESALQRASAQRPGNPELERNA
jgi:sec-independent protein translocase protein TatB